MDKLLIWIFTSVLLAYIVSALDNENININVNVDSDSKTYHQFKTREGSFNYGYNVAKKRFNQFQHKVKGPDDVTYGCYGFVDPKNGTHLYHYVSDLKGYRIVAFNKTTKVYRQRVGDSVKQLLQAVEENLSWDQLYFPEVCRYLYFSQKESNQFALPEDATVRDDGSVIIGPANPKQITSRPSPRPVANAITTPRPIAPTRNVALGTVTISKGSIPTSPRTTLAPRTTAAPKRVYNDYPSKVVEKPVEIYPKVKLNAGVGLSTRKPHENLILNLATTQSETVVNPNNADRGDLFSIGQDIQEVKSTLKKLINHLLSRNSDCNTPSITGPSSGPGYHYHPNNAALPSSIDTDFNPSRSPVVPASGEPVRSGAVTAYLPLIVADFAAGKAPHILGSIPESGSVKLALPAYPAFHPPQCPVCRNDRNKK
ncbi:uncharacterized protein LOC131692139 isoform X2 [Topomyia yanbarensis]|uniref:uncharacterized protein LOC131692139 isoform X2 n=1 Tax=Topomyia yanbarensis TaxID=2498891 RepID=UPI00273CB97F|nr:uncharacterized protein LOC131692139 isoform X2 [Topomyia yanbarensis]